MYYSVCVGTYHHNGCSASECHCPIRQQSGKSRASKGPAPFLGDLGRNCPRPLSLTLMLNTLFSQNGALNALSLASGRARPSMHSSYVIGRISVYEHTASVKAY